MDSSPHYEPLMDDWELTPEERLWMDTPCFIPPVEPTKVRVRVKTFHVPVILKNIMVLPLYGVAGGLLPKRRPRVLH